MANVIFSYTSRLVNSTLGYLRGLLLLFFLSLSSILFADQWVNTEYNTTEGNEFYVTTMKNAGAAEKDENLRIYIYATAREATRVRITNRTFGISGKDVFDTVIDIQSQSQSGALIPLKNVYSDCASKENIDESLSVEGYFNVSVPQDKALHVFTCDANGSINTNLKPFSLYITSYHTEQGYEATNVLPVEALERTYMIQTYHTDKDGTEFVIVATKDNQKFDVIVKVDKYNSTHQNNGQVIESFKEISLNKGQTCVIRTVNANYSLSGTTICSDDAFSIINGNQNTSIPQGMDPVNHIFEQTPSADKWGTEYVVTPTYGYRRGIDYVLLTAIENNTSIKKNGIHLVTLNQGETFTDTLIYVEANNDYQVPHYNSDKKILCYLYDQLYQNTDEGPMRIATPSMTTITPLQMGVNSIILASFNASAEALKVENEKYKPIEDHYVNIVTKSEYQDHIYIDNDQTRITGFKPVPGNNNYYYVCHKIADPKKPHVLYCKNKLGTFTARVYGFHSKNRRAYAYSAGSRVNRPVDMLINDEYIKYKRICLNQKVKFTPLIDYEYDRDSTRWIIGDDVIHFSNLDQDGIVDNYRFDTTGLYDVLLVVHSHTLLCEKTLVDTVKAQIKVDDLSYQKDTQDPCYGDDFKLKYKDQMIAFKADTSVQYWAGEAFRFAVGVTQVFIDTIPADTTDGTDECDLVLRQEVTVRPVYKDTFVTAACDKWVWVDSLSKNRKKDYDTIQIFTIEPGDKLPVWKEHTHHFDSEYGCDSIVTWRVLLNKSYNFTETADTCQIPGGVFKWVGHDSIHIPLDTPGEFTYTDYLTTQQEPYCDSIYRLILTIYPRYESIDQDTICQNSGVYTWITAEGDTIKGEIENNTTGEKLDANAIPTGQAGMFSYSQESKTENGCDSIHHLQLLINPIFDTVIVDSICDNDNYQLNDSIIYSGDKSSSNSGVKLSAQDSPYLFTHRLTTLYGCDSIINLELYVHPTLEEVTDTAVCQVTGGSFTWEGHGEVWSDALQKTVNTIPIDQAGTFKYIDSKTTGHGCDNVYTLNLTVYPTFYSEQDTVLSNEDYIQWQGKVIGGRDVTSVALDYRVTRDTTIRLTDLTMQGCDDIHVLNITYGEVFRDTMYAAVCDNDSIYEWYYKNRKLKDIAVPTTAATYWFNETLKSPIGIDSLIYLELAVFPTYQIDTIDSICTTLPYSWRALDDDENTNWIYDVQNKCMIDAGNIPTTLPVGQQTPQTFVYIDSLKTKACSTCPADGCDSIYVLRLTVLPQYEHIDTLAVCDNDSITWNGEWFYGYKLGNTTQSVTNDTLIERTYSNELGCLSYMRLQLYVLPTYLVVAPTDTTYQHICENETYSTDYGKEYNKNGEWSTPESIISRYVIIDTIQTKTCDSCYGIQCDSVVSHVIYVHPTYEYITTDTICQHDSYTWEVIDAEGNTIEIKNNIVDQNGIAINTIETDTHGTFEYLHINTTADTLQCDSTHRLLLTILPRENTIDTLSMCDNDSVLWHRNGTWLYGDKSGANAAQVYAARNEAYHIEKPANNAYGCDYKEILYLIVKAHSTADTIITICENHLPYVDPHTNQLYYQSTDYYDTIVNHIGCDSIIHINLLVTDTFHTHLDTTICESDAPYYHPDNRAQNLQGLTRSDTYYDTIPTHLYGCDSIIELKLTINPTTIHQESITWCQSKGPYSFPNENLTNLHNLTQSGTYRDTLTNKLNIYNCDSVVEIYLTIVDSIVTTIKVSVCDNELPYNHSEDTESNLYNLSQTGTYRDTLTSILSGCDSVVKLELTVYPTYKTTDTIRICDNDENPYIWQPQDHNSKQEIAIPFSVDMSTNVTNKETVICRDSIMLESIFGCDSLVYLYLEVNPTYKFVQQDTVCQDTINKYWTWHDKQGGVHDSIDISKSGTFIYGDTLKTTKQCDSIFGVELFVKPIYRFDSIYTICQNERIDWQGRGYTGSKYGRKSKYISKQIINDRGDTIAIHSDSIYYEYENGDRILEVGTYYDTVQYTTHLGCDSTYCLQVNVLPSYDTIIDATVCDKDSIYIFYMDSIAIDSISFEPITRMVDSVRKDTAFYTREKRLITKNGCDSTIYMHLTVYPTYEYITTANICQYDTFVWRGNEYSEKGQYKASLQTQYGCDSVYILDLFVKLTKKVILDTNICDNQTLVHSDTLWYENSGFSTTDYVLWEPGMEIPPSNAYQEISYPSADGKCDSVIYQYKIHVHPTSHQIDTLALCSNSSFILHDSLTIHLAKEYDAHYTVAPIDTIFIDTLLSEYGCDNTYEAHATIYPAYRYVTDTSVCENKSIIWRGIEFKKGEGEHRFTEPGDYKFYQTYNTKAYGYECDSIYELRLHVDPIQSRVIDTTICADCPYLFADTLLNTTGVYYDTIQTQAGCDSVLTLNLTVYDTTNVTIYDTICVTEKYKWHDRILTESGDYDTITINQWGCKDYHYLHLNVIDTTSYSLEIGDVLCADDEEIWVFYQYTGRMLIEYSVLFDAMGHAQGFQDIHHAPLDLNANYFSIPIPKGEVLPHPTPTYFDSQQGVNQYTYEDKYAYPLPQKYHMTVIMHNGICGDTLQRKDTIFDLLYPSWIHEQHWNDGIVLYNEQYNGGHIFTSYQWLQNGEKIIGATKEYFYIPSELWMNNRGECNNYYQVELTRLSDGYKTITCPICPVVLEDTIVPREDYYAIVPTTVVSGNPVVHILSTQPGTYTIYDLLGNLLKEPTAFAPDEKNYAGSITLPVGAVVSYYIVNMEMDNGDKRCVIVGVE